MIDGPKGQYALSAGFQNVTAGHSDPFVVGRYNFEKCRLHLGWTRNDRSRMIAGLDCGITDNLTLAVDHWTGDGGSTWAALFYAIPCCPGLSASAMVGVPNDKNEGLKHSFGVFYGFRF